MPKRKSLANGSSARTRPFKRRRKTTASFVDRVTGPQTLIRKLRYCDRLEIDPGASSALGEHFFSCVGLFDPDITGTGHQPMGFDQYMALYDHYQV